MTNLLRKLGRKLGDLVSLLALMSLLLVIGTLDALGRAAWTLARWPRRGRTP